MPAIQCSLQPPVITPGPSYPPILTSHGPLVLCTNILTYALGPWVHLPVHRLRTPTRPPWPGWTVPIAPRTCEDPSCTQGQVTEDVWHKAQGPRDPGGYTPNSPQTVGPPLQRLVAGDPRQGPAIPAGSGVSSSLMSAELTEESKCLEV